MTVATAEPTVVSVSVGDAEISFETGRFAKQASGSVWTKSGGTVVLEALSRGVPVICLDLGGPAEFVTPDCGTIVSTQAQSAEQVIAGLAKALHDHAHTPAAQRSASRLSAMQRARELSWHHQVHRVYQDITLRLSRSR